MKDGLSSVSTPPQFLEELAPHLHSPHLVQAALGALLCRWLFIAPEPMCKDVYSDKEMKMFRALLINGKHCGAIQMCIFTSLSNSQMVQQMCNSWTSSG
jgi:hypothetical protein